MITHNVVSIDTDGDETIMMHGTESQCYAWIDDHIENLPEAVLHVDRVSYSHFHKFIMLYRNDVGHTLH